MSVFGCWDDANTGPLGWKNPPVLGGSPPPAILPPENIPVAPLVFTPPNMPGLWGENKPANGEGVLYFGCC